MENRVWQCTGKNQWIFGKMVRGIVRRPDAEIYFDKDTDNTRGGWVWFITPRAYPAPRGLASSLQHAITMVERALNIEDVDA